MLRGVAQTSLRAVAVRTHMARAEMGQRAWGPRHHEAKRLQSSTFTDNPVQGAQGRRAIQV
eukprot:2094608-Lingulodinium_polyedra.AAC.1